MPPTSRTNPHLRLTAAILVAVFAALAGSIDSEAASRGRRADPATMFGGIRLVSVPVHGGLGVHRAALQAPRHAAADAAARPAAGALGRAIARSRSDASRATGAALLRTTALPPPIA